MDNRESYGLNNAEFNLLAKTIGSELVIKNGLLYHNNYGREVKG